MITIDGVAYEHVPNRFADALPCGYRGSKDVAVGEATGAAVQIWMLRFVLCFAACQAVCRECVGRVRKIKRHRVHRV